MALIGYEKDWIYGSDTKTPVYAEDTYRYTKAFYSSRHRYNKSKGYYDSGGIFLNDYTQTVYGSSPITVYRHGSPYPAYIGRTQGVAPIGRVDHTEGSLHDYGAELYRRARPDKAIYPLGNSLAEMRDIPKMISQAWNGFPNTLKGISSYHLAIQFGWLPILEDLRAVFGNAEKQRKQLAWLLKNNGRPVRRRVRMEPYTSSVTVETGSGWSGIHPILVTQCYDGYPSWVTEATYSRDVWFSGKFVYHLPKLDTEMERDSFLRKLFGLYPSPAAIWRAIPWTWLIGWFSSIGDAIGNISSEIADSAYSEYAYVMRSQTYATKTTWKIPYYVGPDTSSVVEVSSALERHVKERDFADPFASRWTGEDPSLFQLSILAALAGQRRG